MSMDVNSVSVDTLKMFFEMKLNQFIESLNKYIVNEKFKHHRGILKSILKDCEEMQNIKISQDCNKEDFLELYKRTEDAIFEFRQKGVDDDLKFIAKEIDSIKNNLMKM